MKRPAQPSLLPPPAGRIPAATKHEIKPFEFQPGPEAEPRPGWVPPEWLRLPGEEMKS